MNRREILKMSAAATALGMPLINVQNVRTFATEPERTVTLLEVSCRAFTVSPSGSTDYRGNAQSILIHAGQSWQVSKAPDHSGSEAVDGFMAMLPLIMVELAS